MCSMIIELRKGASFLVCVFHLMGQGYEIRLICADTEFFQILLFEST